MRICRWRWLGRCNGSPRKGKWNQEKERISYSHAAICFSDYDEVATFHQTRGGMDS